MTKGSIKQEDMAICNVQASNNRTVKYGKQKLIEIKGEIGKFTITVRDFSSPLCTINGTTRQKISKDIE